MNYRGRRIMDNLPKIIDWFLKSNIYDDGAYVAYYSNNKRGPRYPEITAYAISLSCMLYKRRQEKRFLNRAIDCAKYMMRISRNGGIPSLTDDLLYTFDTGIFISSMFDLYTLTQNTAYLEEAEKSLNWLDSMWNGELSAVNNVPKNKVWYHLSSVHLLKLVIPLLKASTCLNDQKYESRALQLLGRYGYLQKEDGSFIVNETASEVMTHPHCYATEGVLYAHHVLQKNELLESAKRASDWLCKMQNSDGSLYRRYDVEKGDKPNVGQEKLKTSDATAQATRIWKLLGTNQKGIDKAYEYLNGELKENGLRLFKSASIRGRVLSWRRAIYSWPTFFYLHSLTLPFGQIELCSELF